MIYPIDDVAYGNDVDVIFHDEYATSYYIELLDQNNNVVFNTTSYGQDTQNLSITLSGLAAGKYTINIQGKGDDNIIATEDSATFNVTKLTPVIQVNADDVIYPDDVVVNVLVDVNGTYHISLAGQTVKVDMIANEEYNVVFGGVEVGNYTITVTYPETENYTAAINNDSYVEVFDFEFDLDTETAGENTTLRIHVPANATGKIVVTVNGHNYTSNVTNGTAEVTIPDLKDDDDEILISFISDGRYPNKTQNTTNALINSTINSNDMNRGYNSGMDFQATIVDGLNRPIANATVPIIINGKRYTVVSDANGLITLNQKLAVGTYIVTLINPFNNKVTSNALKIVTRITGNKNVNTYYGKNYQYKLRIIADNGAHVGAGVAVKVTINSKAKTLKTDKNGYITVKFTKTYLPKTYTVTAEYKGVKVSNKVVVKKVLTLKKVTVKKSAKKLVLKATLKEGKKALKGKKVVFKFNGKKYTAKTNKKGLAKVTIKKKVLQKLKKGKKVKYQVTYLKCTVKEPRKLNVREWFIL